MPSLSLLYSDPGSPEALESRERNRQLSEELWRDFMREEEERRRIRDLMCSPRPEIYGFESLGDMLHRAESQERETEMALRGLERFERLHNPGRYAESDRLGLLLSLSASTDERDLALGRELAAEETRRMLCLDLARPLIPPFPGERDVASFPEVAFPILHEQFEPGPMPATRDEVAALRAEVAALREEVARLQGKG